MDVVDLEKGSRLAEIVRLVGSRKRRVIMSRPATTVTLSGTYWSGGSRSDYWLVDLNTNQAQPLAHANPSQFGGPVQDPEIQLQPNQVVVKTGVFCGKPATPTIYPHPDSQL